MPESPDKKYWEAPLGKGIFALVGAFCLGSYLCLPLGTAEPYAWLTFGRYFWSLLADGSDLLTEDPWSPCNAAYESSHWLFDLALAALYKAFGESSFVVLSLVANILAVLGLLRLYANASKERFFSGIVALVVACGILIDSNVSPALCSYPLFIATLIFRGWPQLALLLVYANVDDSYLLLPVLLLSFGDRKSLAFWFLALFFNPYWGLHQLKALLVFLRSPGPLAVLHFPTMFLLLLWAFYVVSARERSAEVRLPILLPAILLSILSLAFAPSLPYALIGTGYVLCRLWRPSEGVLARGILELRDGLSQQKLFRGVLFLMICLSVVNIYGLLKRPVLKPLFPERELDYLLAREQRVSLVYPHRIAGYLLHRLATESGVPVEDKIFQTQSPPSSCLIGLVGQQPRSLDPLNYDRFDAFERGEISWRELNAEATHALCFRVGRRCERYQGPWRRVDLSGENPEDRAAGWNVFERMEQ